MQLRSLTQPGKREVERILEDGRRVTEIDASTIHEYSTPVHGVEADVDGLREVLSDITDEYGEYDHEIDAAAAEPVREHLDFSRHIAADAGLWHWLTVSELHEFVYYRWRESGNIEEKFLKAGTDIYSNALHRLWWGAELTRDGNDYTRTETMFQQGELANDVLDRWFARYEPAAKVIVDELDREDSDVISDVTRDVKSKLSGYSLELMEPPEIRKLVTEILEAHDG